MFNDTHYATCATGGKVVFAYGLPEYFRFKRQVAETIIAGSIIGTFMGIYSAIEINKIKSQIYKIQEQQQLLIQITNKHQEQIHTLINDLTRLTSVVEALIQYNPTVFYAQMEEQIDLLNSRIDDTMEVIQQLQNHRLSVKLLTADQLKAMQNEVEHQAKMRGLSPLPTKISDYFQLDTTYTREGDNLLLLVHVPCVPDAHILKIFRYIPFPIPLPEPSLIHPHSIEHALFNGTFSKQDIMKLQGAGPASLGFQEGLMVTPEADLIAIGMDQKYKLLTSAELDGCDRKPRIFLCDQHQVLKSKLHESCLGSLYLRSEAGVREHCKMKKEPLVEVVHQISSSSFLVFSPQDHTFQGTCRNGTQFPVPISVGNNEVHLPEGCRVSLSSHELLSDENVRVSSPALSKIWHWSPLDLPISSLEDPDRHDHLLADIHHSLQNLKTDSKQTSILTNQLSNPSAIPSSWWTILGLILFLFIIILTCYLWHCTSWCQGCKNCLGMCCSTAPSLPEVMPLPMPDNSTVLRGSFAPPAYAAANPDDFQIVAMPCKSDPPKVCRHLKPYGVCCHP